MNKIALSQESIDYLKYVKEHHNPRDETHKDKISVCVYCSILEAYDNELRA